MTSCSSSSDCLPHPARVCSNTGHWQLYKLAWDGQVQIYFGSRTWRSWVKEHLDWIVLFSALMIFGHAIQHSVISSKGQLNAHMTHQPLKCDQRTNCLHFCKAADRWWKEVHAWLFFIVGHMCNPLCTNFLFPQAVGEDMVNTCWRDSDFCSNCHAWNTVHTFKDWFHLFHVVFVHRWCWGSTVRGIIWLFLAIFNDIHPSANSFTWRNVVSLNLFQQLVTF